ncbi:uncharacterized protein N7500_001372 [Penicillium coprophilum]|uniref:uncharacterized protein n=1 Tax=Penicillium coprophilum TaxID=36646 RepID=UPI002397EE18|nr:uncharacterized protein N7500_001372 [Penicillium coprophilum]KAJ5178673.1 hypothetical protein N7500_001372 [Penicillium coprophilum]
MAYLLTQLHVRKQLLIISLRGEFYTDVRLNDTLCERYHVHVGRYSRKVLNRHEKQRLATRPPHFIQCLRSLALQRPHHPTFAAAAGTEEPHAEALIGRDMIVENDMYDMARRQWKEEVLREE